eukprot:6195322-Lingulodinium_polyedra.AAC.1
MHEFARAPANLAHDRPRLMQKCPEDEAVYSDIATSGVDFSEASAKMAVATQICPFDAARIY